MSRSWDCVVTPHARALLCHTGFAFAILLAVVAPGGSNFIIAGAILIQMNPLGPGHTDAEVEESNLRIGLICLFGNALISAFNLLGICITTIAEDIKDLALVRPNDVEYGATEVCLGVVWVGVGDDVTDLCCLPWQQIGRIFSLQFFIFSIISPLVMVWQHPLPH